MHNSPLFHHGRLQSRIPNNRSSMDNFSKMRLTASAYSSWRLDRTQCRQFHQQHRLWEHERNGTCSRARGPLFEVGGIRLAIFE